MKLKSHWAPYLVATGAITLGSLGTSNLAQASTVRPIAIHYTIRLEDQFLATLRYLPVAFKPTTSMTTPTTTTTTTTTPPASTTTTSTTIPSTTTTTTTTPQPKPPAPTALRSGSFVWRYPSLPSAVRSQWSVGTDNVVLKGALMSFQRVEGLTTTGSMNAATWHALTQAVVQDHRDPSGYDYVYVSKTLPEHLELYVNGKVVFTSPVNTGVSAAPTVDGTFPVYLRFTTTTMSGMLPNGQPYHDTGIPWVSYFNGGDALHGFIRSSYGWPQSLGCVEMPFSEAAVLWPHTPIGTLVSVR